jgi:hypothetical protein
VRGPKSAPVEGQHELFGFLTTEENATIAPTTKRFIKNPDSIHQDSNPTNVFAQPAPNCDIPHVPQDGWPTSQAMR